MGNITVKYNGSGIIPTPYIQRSHQFIDYGVRWGNIEVIELNGYLPNVSGTGDIAGALLSLFTSGNFGKLEVYDGATNIYSWDCLNLEEISLNDNGFYKNSFVPYTVKMHRYNVPSGVLEPTNEYSFMQNEDGTVTLNHKISAHGVKTVPGSGALVQAINFVRALTGRNAFAPVFMPNGSGTMTSLTETIDRASCSYAVTEVYRYNTGSNNPYVEYFNSDISDTLENEFLVVNTDLKVQASPIYRNLPSLETPSSLASIDNIMSRLTSLGYQTGNMMLNSMSVIRDSGANSLEIKHSFVSGYNINDVQGYFDYTVSCNSDLVSPRESWKVDGRFVCKGPIAYRQNRLNAFKAASGANWRTTLSGLITSSPIWSSFHNPSTIVSSRSTVDIQENTGFATFQASLAMIEGACNVAVESPKYSVDVTPSKWAYELLPSANIEGHYVVQDLQMATQARVGINTSCECINPSAAIPIISGYVSQLEGIYVTGGSVMAENSSTGLLDASYNREWLGVDLLGSGLLNTKVVGSIVTNYNRQPGFRFGY